MIELFCDTLIEYLDQIAVRRSRELLLHDSPVRLMLGFKDPMKMERVLIGLAAVKNGFGDRASLGKVSARLGYGADQVVDLLRTDEGRAQLLRS